METSLLILSHVTNLRSETENSQRNSAFSPHKHSHQNHHSRPLSHLTCWYKKKWPLGQT